MEERYVQLKTSLEKISGRFEDFANNVAAAGSTSKAIGAAIQEKEAQKANPSAAWVAATSTLNDQKTRLAEEVAKMQADGGRPTPVLFKTIREHQLHCKRYAGLVANQARELEEVGKGIKLANELLLAALDGTD